MCVFLSFWVSIYHFLCIFQNTPKVVQKWIQEKSGHLEKIHTKCSKLIFICSIHKHISVLASKQSSWTHRRHPLISTFLRVHWFLRIHHKKCTDYFYFWGSFQWWFPSRHIHRILFCSAHRSRCLCFSIFVLYFSSVSVFVPLYDLYVMSIMKTYKSFANYS